ncbi:hypothetical protein [Secundilactobacillus silagei]|uniref:Uncharacterized protein n=1 Tax=Secundilactobacillus silagei JCM 19001 TaxID=1302250 RepID=A0A1Z5IHG8_9LACO|nr:hypothetical protein [Secundilactobacillus silagei]TDG72463.1 hypothetical protein C5L25_001839 [Secundilactobacillus silagei JCM 19001]GAX01244.1 hypothetical protein IWT126_01270 [Secundilactobacillus silagei JCM 19001]
MKRFLTSALLTAGASLAVHLYRKQQSPKAFVQETVDHVQARKEALTKVNQQAADVKTRLADFQDELKKAQPAINGIEAAVGQFQFKIQPHVDEINDRLSKLGDPKSNE